MCALLVRCHIFYSTFRLPTAPIAHQLDKTVVAEPTQCVVWPMSVGEMSHFNVE